MSEWNKFTEITSAKGVWLTDSDGNCMIDAVASMWCNVWGHSNKQLIQAIINQSKKLQHSSMFNLTNTPAEELGKKLVKMSPGMYRVFYSDNGSSAMEIAIKMALQYWKNIGDKTRTKIATLENGYHGDTIGAMSVGFIPEFFDKFKKQLFTTVSFPVPQRGKAPKNKTLEEYKNNSLEQIEKRFSKTNDIAAFVMESGAQIAGGVIIYPKKFQQDIAKLCKKYDILLVLDEIATGFGRMGSMLQYVEQNSIPDITAYGKMLTGGYLGMAATLANKKIYDSFSDEFITGKHLFHGHTYTGNPITSSVAIKNLEMYKKYNLIKKITKTAKIFTEFENEISQIDAVTDIRHKGMIMGIELDTKPTKTSLNKLFFKEGKKQGIYLRTLGNVIMLVPPLAITENELTMLIHRTMKTIRNVTNANS